MEDLSHWFARLNGWVERCMVTDYPGSTQNTLSVGNIVRRKEFHDGNTSNSNGRQYRVQRIEYESNKVVQVELLEVAAAGAALIKVLPGEVKRIKSSTLNAQLTQELLSGVALLLLTSTSSVSNKSATCNTQAQVDLIKESVRQVETLIVCLRTAGASLQRDVLAFMFDGIDIDNPDSTTEQKTAADDMTTTNNSSFINAMMASAEAEVVTVSNILWRYDALFGTVRDLYVVLACLLDVTTAIDTRTSATHGIMAESFDVHDIEHDTTPVKARPNSSNNTDRVVDVIQKVLTLESQLLTLIEQHPIPYMIAVKDWANSVCVLSTVPSAILTLHTACTAAVSSETSTSNTNSPITALHKHHTTTKQALQAHFEQVGQAQVAHYSQCMVDNIMRQDWASHSKYMRDKKLTHGIVALCTTMHQSIYEMYQQYAQYVDTTVPYCANMLTHDSFDMLALQMLLSTTILVGRTYLGHYNTNTTESADCSTASGVRVTTAYNTLLAPSRVRTAQWRKDQFYFICMVVETVVWVISQSGVRTSGADTVGVGVKDVLQSDAYVEQAAVVSEIVAVLRYLLLALYISTDTDAGGVIKNLASVTSCGTDASANGGASTSNTGGTDTSGGVYDSLVQLVKCLSAGDYLLDYMHHSVHTSANAIAATSIATTPTDPPTTPQLIQPTRNYDVYGDMHTHTGLFTFHINPSSTSIGVYQTELAAATTASGGVSNSCCVTAAQRAVAFGRIENMCVPDPHYLLALMSTDVELFCAVHCEIHPSDDSCETSQMVSKFMRFSLSRRYELNSATYPALTAEEIAAAIVAQDFIATLPV